LNKEILRLSVPAIVSNITVPLLGLCDTAISGHLGSDLYLAAIAVGSVMLNVVFWLFGFLRMGTTGLTATAFGAGDDSGVRKVFTRAMLLAGGAGVALILARELVMYALMKLIGAEPDVAGYVGRYFMIRIWGSPALLGVLAVSGWFVGMQSTAYPMVIAISVNIVNIAASFALVFWFGLGFEGVAWGTLVSNWVGLAIAMGCALRFSKGKRLWCGVREAVSGGGMGRFFSVNSNLFFRSACIICVTLGVTAAGARLGAATLAINVVVMQFFQFFSFFMDGFAFSGEALVGRWWGAGDSVMVGKYVRALLWWTVGVALLFTVCYGLGSDGITSLLTDSESVRQGVKGMRAWIWSLPVVSAWAFIYDGFYVGVTDTRKMMMSTIVATIVFYIVAFVKLAEGRVVIEVDSNAAVWTAFLSYLFIRGAFLAIAWHIVPRHVK
jgi:MATE family multidrug resistance protein